MSTLEKGNHLELDTHKCLDKHGIKKHQSLIGAIQWAESLGRLDANIAIMNLALFRAELREGNLDRARRLVSYIVKFKHSTIRIGTEETGLSSISIAPYE